MEMTIEEMWDELIELGIATKEELTLVTNINGYNTTAMTDVLYARTALRNFEQLNEEGSLLGIPALPGQTKEGRNRGREPKG